MSPYLGVLPLVFRALKSAFSAPRIWTVDAGYLAKLVKEPAAEATYHNPAHGKYFVTLCTQGRVRQYRRSMGHGKQLQPSSKCSQSEGP